MPEEGTNLWYDAMVMTRIVRIQNWLTNLWILC